MSFFFILRISRLFSDAKKILLYSQNDKSLDGFKELINAVKTIQNNTSGELKVGVLKKTLKVCLNYTIILGIIFSCFVQTNILCECLINVKHQMCKSMCICHGL